MRQRLPTLAIALWTTALTVLLIRVILHPEHNSIFPDYAPAGRAWIHSQSVYPHLTVFFYSPIFAILTIPFILLPLRLGVAFWLLGMAAVFLLAIAAFACWSLARFSPGRLALFFILILPLSLGSLNDGQFNPLLAALLLFSVLAVARQKLNLAAIALALAVALKVHPLCLALLLILLYPQPLGWRFILALFIVALIPFALQRPTYVARQYVGWFHLLTTEDRGRFDHINLQNLLTSLRIPLDGLPWRIFQAAGAGACALLLFLARRAQFPRERLLQLALTLAVCFIMLWGPATESNTFILLSPIAVMLLLNAPRQPLCAARILPAVAYGLLLLAQIMNWFPIGKSFHNLGEQPLAAALLLALTIAQIQQEIRPIPASP